MAIEPLLLADLLRHAVESNDVDVTVRRGVLWRLRAWDVAVIMPRQRIVRANHIVRVAAQQASDFASLVSLVRRLSATSAAS